MSKRTGGRRLLVLSAALAGAVAVVAGAYFLITQVFDDSEPAPAPAPQAAIEQLEPADAEVTDLGFPAFATKNTTRVAGPDPVFDAAGVALAVYPATGGIEGPDAVSLVDVADWQSGIAAASLTAAPTGAPILLTDGGEVPAPTESALSGLAPAGSKATDGAQAFRIGEAAQPGELETTEIEGSDPAEIAAEIDRLRTRLTESEPDHLLLVGADEPAFAMPAAAWAARSGDPVLFLEGDEVPKPTLDALRRHKDVPVFVLGPEDAVSRRAFDAVAKASPGVVRIAGDDPVENAVEFARYAAGDFGWNINDPGHGFVLANADRPADAGAAAPLSASGTWGPLLLTDDVEELPGPLRGYLLDVKPGYEDDPTRAFYNHIWVIGDTRAISVGMQARVDEIADLTKVRSGTGGSILGPEPGTPEPEGPGQGSNRHGG
ncbi:MAG: cell wall-binding repeat-containing protein [bacterium]